MEHRVTERQTGRAPGPRRAGWGRRRQRRKRLGWGNITDSRWGHRHAPTLPSSPGASPWLRLSAQHPHPRGAREPGAPCLLPGGQAHLGEEGARLECAQLQGKSSVSRACLDVCVFVCVCGGGESHTPTAPSPQWVPTPSPDSPAPALGSPQPLKRRARWLPRLLPLQALCPWPLRNFWPGPCSPAASLEAQAGSPQGSVWLPSQRLIQGLAHRKCSANRNIAGRVSARLPVLWPSYPHPC